MVLANHLREKFAENPEIGDDIHVICSLQQFRALYEERTGLANARVVDDDDDLSDVTANLLGGHSHCFNAGNVELIRNRLNLAVHPDFGHRLLVGPAVNVPASLTFGATSARCRASSCPIPLPAPVMYAIKRIGTGKTE